MTRDENENEGASISDLTLRLLRDIRAKMVTKDDLKEELAKVEARINTRIDKLDAKVDKVEARLGERIDVLGRIFKDNHRVLTKRLRAVEIRSGARRPQ